MGSAIKFGVSGVCAGLMALIVGCGSSGSTMVKATALEQARMTVAAVPVGDEAGLYIAQDLGLFRAAGLDVTIKSIVSSADAMNGQNNGAYDITAGNSVSYIQAQVSHQSNLEIVAEGSQMQSGNQALYTLPQSQITGISHLVGKRIGVNALNNIGTLLISSVLESYGINPRQVHFVVVNGSFPGMAQALKQHAIDVAWLPEPFGSIDQVSLGLRKLADLDQGATTNFPVGWYVATKAWAQRHPHTLAAFLGALRQGQEIADTNRSVVEQAMEKLPAPYTVPPAIAAVMTIESYPLTTAPAIDPVTVQRVADEMQQFGMLTSHFSTSTMLRP
ncbi:MAG TPA: ABC transporter substrate-binding protein [Streptosporangiaceae bacterium]